MVRLGVWALQSARSDRQRWHGASFPGRGHALKRIVALKLMKPKLAATPASRKRFIEEARSMAAVQHDNVATIFEVGVEGGVPFMAMELLEANH